MVALSILMVVVLALISSYYSYYGNVKQTMYKNVGQNLAELLLEDTRNLSVSILDSLVKGDQYPPATEVEGGTYTVYSGWLRYKQSTTYPGCYEVATSSDQIDNAIPNGIPFPKDKYIEGAQKDENNTDYDAKYDSGKVDASYRLEKVATVLGLEESPTISPELLEGLPNNVVITPVYYSNENTFDYTILLNKETYPYYKRQIIITDLTPELTQISQKIYGIEVTIYWTEGGSVDSTTGQIVDGVEKSVTLRGEKSFRQ
mgnify:CR=1 FL=1